MLFLLVICTALLTGCSQAHAPLPPWQEICGRDDGITLDRHAVYRARIPMEWRRVDPTTSIADTTTSLCEFSIDDPAGLVRIAIHNFPADDLNQRIPPAAQVARWKRQLGMTSQTTGVVSPIAHGGFTGLCLQGPGILAWAMQLAPTHFRNITDRQQRGDYTLKVTGPAEALQRHRQSLEDFARSFELIKELPEPT